MTASVLTLIAPADKQKLTPALVQAAAHALRLQGAETGEPDWLSEGEACDIGFMNIPPHEADKAVCAALHGEAVDMIAQQEEGRRKALLVTDMDSTIITVECIDEIADFAGVKDRVAGITERAMRGELDFAAALTERVGLLAGLPEGDLQRVYDERVKFMQGARELVATMRANGAYTMLVSGGFDFFTSRVRDALGFHADASNRLETAGGTLTGRVIPPILGKEAKLETLERLCKEHAVPAAAVLSVGDGANDLPMLQAAGLGVAYHAKPLVQQGTRARINHCDLTALLFAQGYKRSEFK